MTTKLKLPWFKFFSGDWLADPALARCRPLTRGIWIDLLCAMYEAGQEGCVSGTPKQLARLARCTTAEMLQALDDLMLTQTAEVTVSNDVVTVVNRRLRRAHKTREANKQRKRRFDARQAGNAPVTPEKPETRGQIPEPSALMARVATKTVTSSSPDPATPAGQRTPGAPTWEVWWAYCQQLGLTAEWFVRDKWEAANAENWQRQPKWQSYAQRCRTWWETDGRPQQPRSRPAFRNTSSAHDPHKNPHSNRNEGTYNSAYDIAAAQACVR
ncbi:MAG TPA: hypothetical protein VF607_15595 [Verrucomicrobiae bacterium]